ncbi:MAG: hypothetical protein MUF10_00290 [Thermoanaerobaculaceae bacterium]|nr:hypothetical protein [Thermoanaerobaculaceae bacterium]
MRPRLRRLETATRKRLFSECLAWYKVWIELALSLSEQLNTELEALPEPPADFKPDNPFGLDGKFAWVYELDRARHDAWEAQFKAHALANGYRREWDCVMRDVQEAYGRTAS